MSKTIEIYPEENLIIEDETIIADEQGDTSWDLLKVRAYLEDSPNVEWIAYKFRRDIEWDCPFYDSGRMGDTAEEAILAAVKATL